MGAGCVVVCDLISKVVIKLVGTFRVDEDSSRNVGEEEEHYDGDGDQHQSPLFPVLQQGPKPPLFWDR